MYKTCMHTNTNNNNNQFTDFWSFIMKRIERLAIHENQTIATIGKYLRKLNFPYCPDGIMAKNANVSSTIEREWIESVAKIKKVTDLDAIIGFDILPDPTNQTRRHVFLGARRKVSLL